MNQDEHQLRRIGGWLLLLIIGLLVGNPLLYAIGGSETVIEGIKSSSGFIFLGGWVIIGIAGLSFAAGLALVLKLPVGIRLAHFFFIVQGVFWAVAVYACSSMQALNSPEGKDCIEALARSILSAGIWMSYLMMSSRVRNTYFSESNRRDGIAEITGVQQHK